MDHVGVPQTGQDSGLSPQARQGLWVVYEIGVEELDGDGALQLDVEAAINLAHPALAHGAFENIGRSEEGAARL